MVQQYDVTSVGVNPTRDRAHRMRVYFIAMSVRIVCVASLFFVRGWWILLVGLAAVILPYFAVIVANQAANGPGRTPTQPEPRELPSGTRTANGAAHPEPTLLVVDSPSERRSQAHRATHEPQEVQRNASPSSPTHAADGNREPGAPRP